ncbi:hypothetical protein EYZ11_008566 [Aspergillus tanneri]|uniref:Uncharacterized protein n=1 Tax=Aspergillus tanneri TaxID=1220188 RepID=A0A4S3JA64_9EURO|nr:hypothetical protein EYZ11_008566 [Aspergillus tanneri]
MGPLSYAYSVTASIIHPPPPLGGRWKEIFFKPTEASSSRHCFSVRSKVAGDLDHHHNTHTYRGEVTDFIGNNLLINDQPGVPPFHSVDDIAKDGSKINKNIDFLSPAASRRSRKT